MPLRAMRLINDFSVVGKKVTEPRNFRHASDDRIARIQYRDA